MKSRRPLAMSLMLICLCLIPVAASAEKEGERESCRVCGMYIDLYVRSAAELVRKDGTKEHTCGVACMLRILDDEGVDAFSSITVHDWNTGNLVDARRATYSIGSRVIPDMIPNFIAFETREAAEEFKAREGGEVIDFNQAMQIVTPRGQTVPARVQPAVTPAKGSFGMGIGASYGRKDKVVVSSDTQDPDEFIRGRAKQPRAPKDMETVGRSVSLNYGITDHLGVLVSLPYFKKQSSRYDKNLTTGAITTTDSENEGLGDLDVRFRYNLWRSTFYDKWFSIQAAATLPTGEFDEVLRDSPGLQTGTGAPSFTGGLLFSWNWRDIWVHASATYTARKENDDDYRYGNEVAAGLALHYTPHYDYLIGIEVDTSHADKNENMGAEVGNTGGTRTNLTFVADWRFLTALGGNFTVRASVGLPIYEDLNHQAVGARDQVQLGGGWYGNVVINYATRFPFFE